MGSFGLWGENWLNFWEIENEMYGISPLCFEYIKWVKYYSWAFILQVSHAVTVLFIHCYTGKSRTRSFQTIFVCCTSDWTMRLWPGMKTTEGHYWMCQWNDASHFSPSPSHCSSVSWEHSLCLILSIAKGKLCSQGCVYNIHGSSMLSHKNNATTFRNVRHCVLVTQHLRLFWSFTLCSSSSFCRWTGIVKFEIERGWKKPLFSDENNCCVVLAFRMQKSFQNGSLWTCWWFPVFLILCQDGLCAVTRVGFF